MYGNGAGIGFLYMIVIPVVQRIPRDRIPATMVIGFSVRAVGATTPRAAPSCTQVVSPTAQTVIWVSALSAPSGNVVSRLYCVFSGCSGILRKPHGGARCLYSLGSVDTTKSTSSSRGTAERAYLQVPPQV